MIHHATKEIRQVFEQKGVKFQTEDAGEKSYIKLLFEGTNVKECKMLFISDDEDADVAIRLYTIAHCPVNRRLDMMDTLNRINNKYRYFKFVLDNDNDINAEYDLPVATPNVGYACYEMFKRAMNIVDEAYPLIQRCLYA